MNNPDPLAGAPVVASPGRSQRKAPDSFPAMIEQLKKQVALALPRHLNADRMARIALTEFRKNPQLAKCDPTSVFAAVIIAAQLGLEPGVMGQGYLIPYKQTCQFVPGWQGMVDLAQRSGRSSVWTGAVYEGDVFDYAYGSSPFITHVPKGEDDIHKLTHVYAVGRVKGAEWPIIDVWQIKKVLSHRDRFNKVGGRHYSFEHAEMYARKVPLLQVLKYMPKAAELALAIDLEHAAQTTGQRLDLQDAIEGTFAYADEAPEPMLDDHTGTMTERAKAMLRERTPRDPQPPRKEPQAPSKEPEGVVPYFNQGNAIAAIRACTSEEALATLRKEIIRDYRDTNRALPLEVEAVWKEHGEVLALKADGGSR